MQYLRLVSSHPAAAYYAIEGDYQTSVRRWIVSTPHGRQVCNVPELLGVEYTAALRAAITDALIHAPFRPLVEDYPETRVCVLHFLRGGLNFGLRKALHEAYGLNAHSSAFMSSQRYRVAGRWQVKEDMYRKLRIPSGALLLTGDVVATGVTVENGLQVLLEHLLKIGSSISGLVFFTIGCHKIEKRLAEIEPSFRDAFPDYRESHVVYLEGKFRLVDSRSELRIGIPGTDLIRRDCLLAPEFEASQYDSLSYPLERCTVYDAGSRAYDIPRYVGDVLSYWRQLGELAAQGLTLGEALAERWPETEYSSLERFLERKSQQWRGLGGAWVEELHRRYRERWTDEFTARARSSAALRELCADRVAGLERIVE